MLKSAAKKLLKHLAPEIKYPFQFFSYKTCGKPPKRLKWYQIMYNISHLCTPLNLLKKMLVMELVF